MSIEIAINAIGDAYALLPAQMRSAAATRFLVAAGLQESRLEHRWQVLEGGWKGPARGLWQFERGGGVDGVLTHPASRYWAYAVCRHFGLTPTPGAVWRELERNDVLAAAFARLLLFTDPYRIPTDEEGAWKAYALRLWRPGALRRQKAELRAKWTQNWAAACKAVP